MSYTSGAPTPSGPIRFGENVVVSALWKMSENLIDLGGKGHKVISLKNDQALIYDEQKITYLTSVLVSALKVTARALLCLSVVGAHIAVESPLTKMP